MPRVPRKWVRYVKRTLNEFGGADISGVGRFEGQVQVSDAGDLPDPVDGVIELEPMTSYKFNDIVILEETVKLGYGSPIVASDPFNGGLIHTGGGNAIEADDVPVWITDAIISAPGGTVFDIRGQKDKDMKIDRAQVADPIGMGNMESLGTVEGMRVPVFDGCNFENADDGLHFKGESDKIYVRGTPFRNIGGASAIYIEENVTSEYIKIDNCFFRNLDAGTAAISVANPLSATDEGKIINNDFAVPIGDEITGVDRGNVRWEFAANSGIQNSGIRGGLSLESDQTVNITQEAEDRFDADAYVKVDGPVRKNDVLERVDVLEVDGPELTYTGSFDAGVKIDSRASLSGSNLELSVAIFVNGEIQLASVLPIDVTPRGSSASFQAQTDIREGDVIDLRVANLDGTSNPTVKSLSTTVSE